MSNNFEIVLYSFFSGITVFIGGLISWFFDRFGPEVIKEEVRHSSIAFGGGILLSAVAFVLVPEGIDRLPLAWLVFMFLSGTSIFLFIDKWIERMGGSLAQLMAMLMDFVPEAIALGAVFSQDRSLGFLLALLIGLQNLPEAFNSYLDLRKSGQSPMRCLQILLPLSFVGIAAALLGDHFLSGQSDIVASMMVFASGGIIYLIFDDIAPESKVKNHRTPAFAASLGFMVGIVSDKILG